MSTNCTILIVDDSDINRAILSDMLYEDYNILEAVDGQEAIDILEKQHEEISLVLLDIVMPVKDGFDVLREMNEQHWIDTIPVLIISANPTPENIQKAYDFGAIDFVSKPFISDLLYHRIRNVLALAQKQAAYRSFLSEQINVSERNTKIMLSILRSIIGSRNGESGISSLKICKLTSLLLHQVLYQHQEYSDLLSEIPVISLAAALHDIGKMSVPQDILNKPGKLTEQEFEIVKTHTTAGAGILTSLTSYQDEDLIRYAKQIALWHHERFDGNGYPDSLSGQNIPLFVQVVSISSVYIALTSNRSYRSAYSPDQAFSMIISGECGIFNPELLKCFQDIRDDILAIDNDPTSEVISFLQSTGDMEDDISINDLLTYEKNLNNKQIRDIFLSYSNEPWVCFDYNSNGILTLNDSAQSLLHADKNVYTGGDITSYLKTILSQDQYRYVIRTLNSCTPNHPSFDLRVNIKAEGKEIPVHITGESQFNSEMSFSFPSGCLLHLELL